MRTMICFIIKLYQYVLSPILKPSCRFAPSCSHYAIEAIQHHGLAKGCWYAIRRVARCHPWGGSGFDPIPPSVHNRTQKSVHTPMCSSFYSMSNQEEKF